MWQTHFCARAAGLMVVAAVVLAGGGASAQSDVDAVLRANRLATGAPPPRAAQIEFTYSFGGMGFTGSYISIDDLTDGRFVNTVAVGPLTQVQGFDGENAWQKDASGEVTLQSGGDQRQSAVSQAYQQANLWWRADHGGARIVAEGVRRDSGGAFDVLSVTPPGGRPFEAWFDVASHLLSRTVQGQGARSVSDTFRDYQPFEGVMQARTVVIDDGSGPAQVQTLTIRKVRYLDSRQAVRFASPDSQTRDASIVGARSETSLPFRLVDNRVYAEVRISGEGPFLFQFDTGAADSLTAGLAQALGLGARGHARETGAGEGVSETGWARVPEIRIGDARISDQVFEVGGDGLETVEGLGDRGIIGSEVFQRLVTRIDYPRGLITFIDPATFDPKDAGTPVHFEFEGNVIEVAGDFEGVPGRFIVDTGSRADLVLNKPFADRNGIRSRHSHGVEIVAGWGTNGPSRAWATRGASLGIGPIRVPRLVALLSTDTGGAFAGTDFDGDIGGGILKRFVVTFDYRHQTMYLKPAAAAQADVGTYDRAGMWFNRSPAGFTIIGVGADTPAARAGLLAGDEIVRVDGAPASGLKVYDLRYRLRNDPPGTVVKFDVLRKGQPGKIVLILRDLI